MKKERIWADGWTQKEKIRTARFFRAQGVHVSFLSHAPSNKGWIDRILGE